MRVLYLSLTVLLAARLASPEEDKRSLAERAEAARGSKKRSPDKVLTNEDLKKAKGNVIILSATATPPPPAVTVSAYREVVPVVTGTVGEQREQAARLRGSIEEAQRQLGEVTADQRMAIELRLKNALDELARTHETIGAMTERARLGASPVPPSQ